jgi:hypothetical protein
MTNGLRNRVILLTTLIPVDGVGITPVPVEPLFISESLNWAEAE